MKKGR